MKVFSKCAINFSYGLSNAVKELNNKNYKLGGHLEGLPRITKRKFSRTLDHHLKTGEMTFGLVLVKTFPDIDNLGKLKSCDDQKYVSASLFPNNGGVNMGFYPGSSCIGCIIADRRELIKNTRNMAPYDLGMPEFSEGGWSCTRDVEKLKSDKLEDKWRTLREIENDMNPVKTFKEGFGGYRPSGASNNELRIKSEFFFGRNNVPVLQPKSDPIDELTQLDNANMILMFFKNKLSPEASKDVLLVPKAGVIVKVDGAQLRADLEGALKHKV